MCLLTSESKNLLAVHTDAICNTLTCITRVRTTFFFVAVVVTLFVNPKWYFVRINKTLTERRKKPIKIVETKRARESEKKIIIFFYVIRGCCCCCATATLRF